jgi:hypothetical protein
MLPLACTASEGLPVREELRPYSYSSSGIGMRSGWKAGNLNVVCGLGSRAEEDAMASALGVSRGCEGLFVRHAMGTERVRSWMSRAGLAPRIC